MTRPIREVYWILGSLITAVSVASLIGYALHRSQPANPAIENLNARIRSWWGIILLGGGALLAGRVAIILLFAFVSFVALREFVTHTPVHLHDRSAVFVCFLALPLQYLLIGIGWYDLFSICIPVFGFPALAIVALLSGSEQFLERASVTQWGLMLCVYSISYIPALLTLRIPGYDDRAPLLVVFVVLIAQVSDILQYVWGKLIGRHPVAPKLSPSKTVEGLVGGVLSATLLGALLWTITPFTPWRAAWMAFVISILGFVGGLVLSAVKRDRGIKDWGHSIGGHGGMLDRMDSLCFSAPVFFYFVRYFSTQT